MTDDELAGLSEFALLRGNAEQAGVTGPAAGGSASTDTADGRSVRCAGGRPGRGWCSCTAARRTRTPGTPSSWASGEPALAVDLPGHGRSAWRDDGDYSPQRNAATLDPVLHELAPDAELVVGMSLGGLTAIRLAATAPELVRRFALVDVTPSALQRHAELSAAAARDGRVGAGRTDVSRLSPRMLDRDDAAAPHRDAESLRRGRAAQLPPARRRQLDVALRHDALRRRLHRAVDRCRGDHRPHHADPRRRLGVRHRRRTSPSAPGVRRVCAPTWSPAPGTRCRVTSRGSWSSCCAPPLPDTGEGLEPARNRRLDPSIPGIR